MKKAALIFVLAVGLAGCGKTKPHSTDEQHVASPERIGVPSLAGISEHAHAEAMAAFEHAKRFITTGRIDTVQLDLSKPMVFHRPGSWPVDYDWSVSFSWKVPSPKPPYGKSIAVRNDGKCWLLEQ